MAISNEQLISAIKKNPIVTVCVVVVLACGVGLYLRQGEKPDAERRLEDLSKQGRRMSSNIKNAVHLDDELQALTAANEQIDKRLVDASQLADNLQYFYELEATTGIKLIDLRQIAAAPVGRGPAKKTLFSPVNFSVALSGTYEQLIDFLQRLEGGRYFCRVLTADFAPYYSEGSAFGLARPDELTLSLSIELLGKSTS